MRRRFRRVDSLRAAPYSGVVAYPGGPARGIAARLGEMKRLGVTGVSFEGPARIGGVRVLGKGHAGVVVLAALGRGRRAVALKVRRTDSPRASMALEARLLAAANAAGAGPRLVGHTRNLLAMEHIDGDAIERWLAGGGAGAAGARRVARAVLEDCYRLDACGLDHGELSNIARHVLVAGGSRGPSACIVDFESSSMRRRASNVTSAAQSMFVGSAVAGAMAGVCRAPRADVIGALREYKRGGGRERFEALLGVLGL